MSNKVLLGNKQGLLQSNLMTVSGIGQHSSAQSNTACEKVTSTRLTSAKTNSKAKTKAGRSLRDRQSGRVLQSAKERSAEWASYCTDLLSGSTPIAREVLAQLPPPPPPSDFPYPEPTLDEVVTAIKRRRNNKAAGIRNILPELLKYGGDAWPCTG